MFVRVSQGVVWRWTIEAAMVGGRKPGKVPSADTAWQLVTLSIVGREARSEVAGLRIVTLVLFRYRLRFCVFGWVWINVAVGIS